MYCNWSTLTVLVLLAMLQSPTDHDKNSCRDVEGLVKHLHERIAPIFLSETVPSVWTQTCLYQWKRLFDTTLSAVSNLLMVRFPLQLSWMAIPLMDISLLPTIQDCSFPWHMVVSAVHVIPSIIFNSLIWVNSLMVSGKHVSFCQFCSWKFPTFLR